MKSDITNHVAACSACTEDLQAQPRHKHMEDKKPTDMEAPMEEIGVDYYNALGTNWLVAVDRYSSYAWTAKVAKATTDNTLRQLVTWFDEFGWPKKIRSDGGPQFRQTFTSFCKLHGISHELASAYNPESNRLAEKTKASHSLLEKHKATERLQRSRTLLGKNTAPQVANSPTHAAGQRLPRRDDLYRKQIDA